jgi:hypothetical protein
MLSTFKFIGKGVAPIKQLPVPTYVWFDQSGKTFEVLLLDRIRLSDPVGRKN